MDLTATKKISVIGNSGAGKSTLSQQLRARLGIEVFSIDKIFWLPRWQMRDHESFKSLHDKWLQSESWIIEGVGYWSQVEQRLTESGIVIFVDAPVSLC